ncbi:hypothetical protein RHMOL_Rhmol09G0077900 [Rhododendron molle]|uniref:Uncharacterized protein n=1 Tax=Rhododendron molle TaxID=49168 RepID=A0ACC0MC93_RHOML|nr:hypothetical protein RHMOL_Rhmol09G0077900 [Rhododendron molle]
MNTTPATQSSSKQRSAVQSFENTTPAMPTSNEQSSDKSSKESLATVGNSATSTTVSQLQQNLVAPARHLHKLNDIWTLASVPIHTGPHPESIGGPGFSPFQRLGTAPQRAVLSPSPAGTRRPAFAVGAAQAVHQ